jgi:predicted Na+-dependent transporter
VLADIAVGLMCFSFLIVVLAVGFLIGFYVARRTGRPLSSLWIGTFPEDPA